MITFINFKRTINTYAISRLITDATTKSDIEYLYQCTEEYSVSNHLMNNLKKRQRLIAWGV